MRIEALCTMFNRVILFCFFGILLVYRVWGTPTVPKLGLTQRIFMCRRAGTLSVSAGAKGFGAAAAGHWPAIRRLIRSFRIRRERSFFPSFGEEEQITFALNLKLYSERLLQAAVQQKQHNCHSGCSVLNRGHKCFY